MTGIFVILQSQMVLKATVQNECPEVTSYFPQSLPKVTPETVVRRCSSKWVLLEVSQHSQETSVLESLLNKVTRLTVCYFI